MSNKETSKSLKLKETKKYLEYIKKVLVQDKKMIDYIDFIPFEYDEELLKEECEKNGIAINYSSSYYIDGKYNPYFPQDKLIFTRKIVK